MAKFYYKVITDDGKILKDTITASTIEEAKESLRANKYHIVEVTEKKAAAFEFPIKQIFFGTISKKDVALITRQLAVLLGSGTPILKALEIIIEQGEFKALCKILSDIKTELAQGSSFSTALKKYPNIFSELYVNMVKAGEASGELPKVLVALSDNLIESEQLKGKIITALTYPFIVIGFSIVVIFILFIKVIPQITSFLIQRKVPLPLPTRILINISLFFQAYWLYLLIFATLFVLVLIYLKSTKNISVLLDKLILKIPILGNVVLKNSLARFSKTLAMLLENGIPMAQAIVTAGEVTKNAVLQEALVRIRKDVIEGMSVSMAMSKYKFLPRTLSFIIGVGEESGELPQLLKKLANGYKEEMDILTAKFLSILEPMLTLGLSVFVIFVVLSIMLPIIDMLGTIK
jgi:type II secretory pathway component PulF